jgi:hypothetical protein
MQITYLSKSTAQHGDSSEEGQNTQYGDAIWSFTRTMVEAINHKTEYESKQLSSITYHAMSEESYSEYWAV